MWVCACAEESAVILRACNGCWLFAQWRTGDNGSDCGNAVCSCLQPVLRRSLGTLCHCQALFDEVCYWAVCLSARWAQSNIPNRPNRTVGFISSRSISTQRHLTRTGQQLLTRKQESIQQSDSEHTNAIPQNMNHTDTMHEHRVKINGRRLWDTSCNTCV